MVPRGSRLAKNWGEKQITHPNENAGQIRLARGEHRAIIDAYFRSGAREMITVTRYGTRYWAVRLDGELVVVALYKKGAASVAAKLRELLVLKGS